MANIPQERSLRSSQFARSEPVPAFSLTPDDKRFLMVREGEATQSEPLVAENWLQQLEGQPAK